MTEYQIQKELLEWCESMRHQYPGIDRMIHVQNEGKRRKKAIGTMKGGMRFNKGFPDLFLPMPLNGYCGLMIELKVPGNTSRSRASPEQMEWLCFLSGFGYRATVCKGLSAAQTEIIGYFEGLV